MIAPLDLRRLSQRCVLALTALTLSGCVTETTDLVPLPIGGDVDLQRPDGSTFRLADHPDDVKLLFFGYTSCPDACPTALGRVGSVARRLEERGGRDLVDRFLVVLVTIDPARDDSAKLTEYLTFFGLRPPGVVGDGVRGIGLRGSETATAQAARAYGASYERIDQKSGIGYSMDHTTYLYLIDKRGRVRRLIRSDDPVDAIAAWVETLVGESS
jgi:protein SCO1/2